MIIKNFRNAQVSVKDAIEASILASCYGDGEMEAIKGYCENAALAIAKVVDRLSDKGILNKDDIKEMIGYNYHIED